MTPVLADYPVRFSVEYPDGPWNRLTVALRIFTVIPIALVLTVLTTPAIHAGIIASSANVSLAVVLMLVCRRKYPRWWFDWLLALSRFLARVTAYLLLLQDDYPSTDEEQAVHLEIDYPAAERLNRWLPLVKWLLAIPHYVALALLLCAVVVVTIVSWFVVLVTGRYPRGLFDFVVGAMRWSYRVAGYAFLLVTDRYPPFSIR